MIHAIAILIASVIPSTASAVSSAQLDGDAVGYCAACPEIISAPAVASLNTQGLAGSDLTGVVPAASGTFDPSLPTIGGDMSPEDIRAYEARMHETAALPHGTELRGAPVFDREDDPIGHISEVESRTDGTILSALVTVEDTTRPAYDVRMQAEQLTIMLGEGTSGFEVFLDLHRDALLEYTPATR